MSHELVGRPLIPFFDQQDNINASLTCNDTVPFEKMDVDARVWNKKLGYFEYPSSVTSQKVHNKRKVAGRYADTKRSNSTGRNQKRGDTQNVCSGPISILSRSEKVQSQYTPKRESFKANYDQLIACSSSSLPSSFSSLSAKCLLTPQMLASSCPVAVMEKPALDFILNETISKPKEKNEAVKKQTNLVKRNTKERRHIQKTTHGNIQRKPLDAGEKWAWSAFQTSPDPDKLPLPPFIMEQKMNGISVIPTIAAGVLAEPVESKMDVSDVNGQSIESEKETQPPLPPPPLGKNALSETRVYSIEQSMTQDLCRMLNIG